MQQIIVEKDGGCRSWLWDFPGSQEELINAFVKGEAPIWTVNPLSGEFRGKIRELAWEEEERLTKRADAFVETVEGFGDEDSYRLQLKGRCFFTSGRHAACACRFGHNDKLPVFILNLRDRTRQLSVWSHSLPDVRREFLERPGRKITEELESIEEIRVRATEWLCLHESLCALERANGQGMIGPEVLAEMVPNILSQAKPRLPARELYRAFQENLAVRWLVAMAGAVRDCPMPELAIKAGVEKTANRALSKLRGHERRFFMALCHPTRYPEQEDRLETLEPVAKAFRNGKISRKSRLGRLLEQCGERERELARETLRIWQERQTDAAHEILG